MDEKEAIRDFLSSRRAKISPEQAGLTMYGGQRRVPGLRREEVAMLAGISVDYYTRLERGNLKGTSHGVLEAIARALQLDVAEREHLFDLARRSDGRPAKRRPTPLHVRPAVRQILDAITEAPAMVMNWRKDILATNLLARALYLPVFARGGGGLPGSGGGLPGSGAGSPGGGGFSGGADGVARGGGLPGSGAGGVARGSGIARPQAHAAEAGQGPTLPLDDETGKPANMARFIYLDPVARQFFPEWDRAADDVAAMLRIVAGKQPHDRALTELIGELSTLSEDFRQKWAAHDVRSHRSGVKKLSHPIVGEMELDFEAMDLSSEQDVALVVYTARPGSPSADALRVLASWAATQSLERKGAGL